MKTIEQHNKDAENAGVQCMTFTIESKWRKNGIMCPCGCDKELEELWPNPYANKSMYDRIRCPTTKKEGKMVLDGSAMGLIKGVEWH